MREPEDQLREAVHLGDLVNGHPENVTGALPRLAELVGTSTELDVVVAATIALGHAWDPRAARALLDHVPIDHPDTELRLELTRALPGGVDHATPVREEVIAALIALTRDTEDDVRDWACFGLGTIEADSPETREALAARLLDRHPTTRREALTALAATGDTRALAAVAERLASEGQPLFERELEAAANLGSPELYPLLTELAEEWAADEDDLTELLTFALARCHPDAPARADQLEGQLVAVFTALATDLGVHGTTSGLYPHTLFIPRLNDGSPVPEGIWRVWTYEEPATFKVDDAAKSYLSTLKTSFPSPNR
jgi:hypothetical protein